MIDTDFASNAFDPGQREHELADALLTLLIACSRYGINDKRPCSTADRLETIERVTHLVADQVAERIRNLRGQQAADQFRAQMSWRRL